MALATVGGALLSSFLNVMFDRMASREFLDFFKTQRMDKGLLQKLEILLNTVNGVLDDAEEKHGSTLNVKFWFDNLRDAVYETDDLLDLIAYEATAAKVEAQQQTTGNQFKNASVKDHSDGVVSSRDVPKRMEEIVERLELLVQQIGPLGLKDSGRKDALPEREPTTSVVEESGIFGRDSDKEAIFKMLQAKEADGNSIGVIPIVGMGRIGKTTLAQLVYNDSRAQDFFECKAWVCVSENYDGFKIKREVLKQVRISSAYDGMTPQQIDEELKKSLKNKRYLLVLDDMWNDSYADWNKLLTPLESGECRSKIIITTRNQSVASIMCTVPSSYRLHELDAHHCWLLFVKHAFNSGSVNDERLEAIGKKIVKKWCKGLPLAAKMLGGLLRCKREVTEWEDILNNNIWDLPNDNVLPALRLSYQHLPSYLKQCFAYCAIFPKDYQIEKEEIIHLWMAEGLLAQPKGGKKLEELGENRNASYDTDSQVNVTDVRNGVPIGPQAASPWLHIYPRGIRDLLVYVKGKYNNPLIYITENGVDEANNATWTLKEALNDKIRVSFYHDHLFYVSKAIADGVKVKGYFAWSLLDNFEWSAGYSVRFGINYVDYKNGLKRYPKLSSNWFKKFLKP